jgi:tetratricopeptide (TPR) repeat protein
MTDFSETRCWLNQFDRSHISPATEPSVKVATDPLATDLEKTQSIAMVLETAKRSYDLWEYPELLIISAEIEYFRHNLELAHRSLSKAQEAYRTLPDNTHRLAISEWLLGLVEWELHLNRIACNHWRSAREGFVKLGQQAQAAGLTDRADWYEEKALAMSVALAGMPEEGYMWYRWVTNLENPNRLSALDNLEKQLSAAIDRNNVPEINLVIHRIVELARGQVNGLERAEAYLECGLAKYQLREAIEAYRFMHLSIASFHPGIIQQGLARWVLGSMYHKGGLIGPAIKHWNQCLETFSILRTRANWNKDIYRIHWVQDKMDLMQRAFTQLVSG